MCNVQTGLDKTLTVELSWEVWNPVHDSALESSSQDSLRAVQKKKKKEQFSLGQGVYAFKVFTSMDMLLTNDNN